MTSKELAETIEKILDSKKGIDIQVIDLEGKTDLADFFVIATGTSTPHIRALSEEVEFKMKEDHGMMAHHTEGRESGKWILLDYGGVIVHVFHETERAFYSLEKLWEGRYGKSRQ
ncbi:MAG: ribosome silencing factor [Saccharofermentanales bacterium]